MQRGLYDAEPDDALLVNENYFVLQSFLEELYCLVDVESVKVGFQIILDAEQMAEGLHYVKNRLYLNLIVEGIDDYHFMFGILFLPIVNELLMLRFRLQFLSELQYLETRNLF